jgi:Uma2 family endonuclease
MNWTLEMPSLSPRSLVLDPPLSDEEFERMSMRTDLALVERRADGAIIVNALGGARRSWANIEVNGQLGAWCKRQRNGRVLLHCGFFLDDGSCMSAPVAYVTASQVQSLSREERKHFLRVAPAVVIEVRAEDASLSLATKKMENWIANGVQLGWLIDPEAKQVHVYAQGAAPRVESGSSVSGSGPVQGFVLDLEEVWRCYE